MPVQVGVAVESFEIVIVGAGHGGAQAAIMLRQLKFSGSIALLGEEPEFPYERPPLSKEYLSGERPFERILMRPPAFWEERKLTLRLGARVSRVDSHAHRLTFEDGGQLEYGRLVWAGGGAPRRLRCAGNQLRGVHTVRARADVDRMLAELPATRRVVVIGGGFIGLEAAAVLRKLGKSVILLESLDRVLARVAGPELSRFFEAEHRAHGVDIRLGVTVECIEGANGAVTGVRLIGGEVLPAEMVILGIGIIPAVAPLLECGAHGDNGIHIDEFCRTSVPDVYAIGDCAAYVSAYAGGTRVRVESVQNAVDQANAVAQVLTGNPRPYRATPWFWSNQYDLRLQTVGLSTNFEDIVLRGEPASRSFSLIYLRGGRVIALDCINATKDYIQGRKLVESAIAAPRSVLADVNHELKDLVSGRR